MSDIPPNPRPLSTGKGPAHGDLLSVEREALGSVHSGGVSGRAIEVVGHGGAADFFPGNSRQSIEKAIELGVDRVEIDVQVAGDGSLVLVHDDQIKINGKRTSLRHLSRFQIADALDGFMTLDEVIELTRGRCGLMVDLKSRGYEEPVARAIRQAGIESETIVTSTFALSLRRVKKHAPGVRLGLSTGHISTVMRRNLLVTASAAVVEVISQAPVIGVAKSIDADFLMLNYRICGKTFVKLAHRFDLGVYCWTVNHPKHIQRMVDINVDGIISNRPDLVAEARGRAVEEWARRSDSGF